MQTIGDKVKALRNDLTRKEALIKELRAQPPKVTVEKEVPKVVKSADSDELEETRKKLRDAKQKHKLELQLKDNHIRSLKLKVEQTEEQLAEARKDAESSYDLPVQQKAFLEKQHKQDRKKLKKYDQVVKDSLGAIQKLTEQFEQQTKSS